MKAKDNFQQIEKYLDGSMSGEELSNFEETLANDSEFLEQVDFQKNMEFVLAKKPADDLRKNLKTLRKKHSQPKKEKNNFWLLVFILIVLGGIIFWQLNGQEQQTTAPAEQLLDEKIEEKNLEENLTKDKEEEIDKSEIEEKQSSPKKDETKSPPSKKTTPPKQKKKPILIAADFEPNEFLESRLSSLRSGDFEIEDGKEKYDLRNGKINFELAGNFKPDNDINESEILIHIFSNKQADYENFEPVFSKEIEFVEGEDSFDFQLNEEIEMKAGLYYFQVEDEKGEILFLGKFEVRE